MIAGAAHAGSPLCPADHVDRRSRVDFVYDGDTIRLADGTDVRLIGVNAPEIDHDGDDDEPHAHAARRALQRLLAAGDGEIAIRRGAQPRDDHGRLLGHAYLPDGRSVAKALLTAGDALHVVVPPNTWHHRCYARAEALARTNDKGLWRYARYRGGPTSMLADDVGGFRVVTGRIRRVGESRRAFWLELDGLTLRLPKADLRYFDDGDPERWQGRRLRVRGWIYRVDGQRRMALRHPASVTWLEQR